MEKKEGWLKHKDFHITVIDLPGTYGLSAYSPDELVARKVIIDEKPDVLVDIVDASNLERNLYLTTQLMELEVPVVLVLNMADIAERNGIIINHELLSQLLGIPVVRAVGTKNEGTADILDAVVCSFTGTKPQQRLVRYRPEVEEEIEHLQKLFNKENSLTFVEAAASNENEGQRYPLRWSIIKLLEKDREIMEKTKALSPGRVLLEQLEQSRQRIESKLGDDLEMILVEDRYAFIRGICREVFQFRPIDKVSLTEKIDNVLLNRVLGIPLFLGMMWLLFQLTFTLGEPLMDLIEVGFANLGIWVNGQMAEGLLRSLLVDGIIGGVGGVIVFLPVILLLFLGIAFLEGTGYMARQPL